MLFSLPARPLITAKRFYEYIGRRAWGLVLRNPTSRECKDREDLPEKLGEKQKRFYSHGNPGKWLWRIVSFRFSSEACVAPASALWPRPVIALMDHLEQEFLKQEEILAWASRRRNRRNIAITISQEPFRGRVATVTFLLLWRDTMTEATCRRKHLTGAHSSRR